MMKGTRKAAVAIAAGLGVIALAAIVGEARAYDSYSGGDGNCAVCHEANAANIGGGFQKRQALHQAHTTNATATCTKCHIQQGDVPPPSNCAGCHGQGATGGAGLRAHHALIGVPICSDCHSDGAPPGENTMPPYYGQTDVVPTNPCNTDGKEDFWDPAAGAVPDGLGLDNDGDGLVDQNDTDCAPVACVDKDQDGFGSPADPSCPKGNILDCDDNNAAVYPGAPERFDQADNDCDTEVDEIDNDGFFSTTNRDLYTWNAQLPAGQTYDVIRSDGPTFPAASAFTACVGNNLGDASFAETVAVPAGKAFYYLVRNSSVGNYGKMTGGALRIYGTCP